MITPISKGYNATRISPIKSLTHHHKTAAQKVKKCTKYLNSKVNCKCEMDLKGHLHTWTHSFFSPEYMQQVHMHDFDTCTWVPAVYISGLG